MTPRRAACACLLGGLVLVVSACSSTPSTDASLPTSIDLSDPSSGGGGVFHPPKTTTTKVLGGLPPAELPTEPDTTAKPKGQAAPKASTTSTTAAPKAPAKPKLTMKQALIQAAQAKARAKAAGH